MRKVYWNLDFTTMNNTTTYTAEVVIGPVHKPEKN
jgi:hypothetical protein